MKMNVKNTILKTIAVVFMTTAGSLAYAQGAMPGAGGLSVAFSGMYLSSSTEQGGAGADGSTLLTETELMYSDTWFNYGALLQFDAQGSAQTDVEIAYKVEYEMAPFYVEAAYSLYVKRTFTDRSIAEQTGTGYRFGGGVRVPLTMFPSMFMQFSLKSRTQIIDEQDGKPLDENITQSDLYPAFGIGMKL